MVDAFTAVPVVLTLDWGKAPDGAVALLQSMASESVEVFFGGAFEEQVAVFPVQR